MAAKKMTPVSGKTVKATAPDRPGSKQNTIVALLRRPEGAGLDVLVKETAGRSIPSVDFSQGQSGRS